MNDLYKIQSRQLNDLFKEYFIICKNDVQRDFVWDVNKCLMLLDDILNENGRFYGINTMGFSYVDEPLRKIECYDGQQRLTTYSLLIISLYFFIDTYIDNNNDKKIKVLRMLKSLILKTDYFTYQENLVFIPNDGNSNNIETYQNILKLEKNQDFEDYISNNNCKNNKYVKTIKKFYEKFGEIYNDIDMFYDNLSNFYKNIDVITSDDKFLLSIVNSIINKPIIMMYIGSEEDKYQHFINQMKGEKLIPSQFFESKLNEQKNRIDDNLVFDKICEFLELFNHIKYVFDDNGNYEANDNLLKHLIYYKTYKNHRVNNGLVDEIFNSYNNFNTVHDIDYAINIAKIYIDILNLKKEKTIKYLNELNSSYDNICEKLRIINNVLKIRDTFNPIIIMLFIKYNNDYEKICNYLDLLIKYGFLQFKLYKGLGNVDIRPIVEEIINVLNENEDEVCFDFFRKIILSELEKLHHSTNITYVEKILSLKSPEIYYSVNFNKDLVKFILLEYYKSQEDDDSEELIFNKLSIEHIIPKKYEENYSYLDVMNSKESVNQLINLIGNQLLLVLKANQKISNKSIEEKVVYYKKSKFNENVNFSISVENCPNQLPVEIINRHSKIIDFIGEYFKI